MNLFNIYIISIFAYICEGYTLWLYCSGLFERRYNFIKRLLIYIIFYTIPILFIGLRIFSLNCILFFLMTMLIICTAYKVTPGKSMLHALLATFIMCITELIVMVAVPDYGQNVLGYIDSFKVQVMIYYISKLLYLIFMYIASYILSKKEHPGTTSTLKVFAPVGICAISVFIINSFCILCVNISLSTKYVTLILISATVLLCLNVLAINMYNYIEKQYIQNEKLNLQLQNESLSIEYYKQLAEMDEKQKIMIHDIKNHLLSIKELNKEHNYNEIDKYISTLLYSEEFSKPVMVSDNEILNAIAYRFQKKCSDKNITFITDIRSKTVSFISPDDCTSLFCNLLDNAYEAACKTDDGHITLKICSDTSDKLTIMVNVVNSCNGNPFDSHGKLKTSKKDTISHGYGLKSIERVVNKYNGFIDMYYDENDSTFHTLISFSDRM